MPRATDCSPYGFTEYMPLFSALGLLGGPIIAAIYSSGSEVLSGQHVPLLFTVFRVGMGTGVIIGPTIAGNY